MPNTKKLIQFWTETGKTIYAIIQNPNGKYLQTDMASWGTGVGYPVFTEHSVIKNLYQLETDGCEWVNGLHIGAIRLQDGASPDPANDLLVGGINIIIKDDEIVTLDASVEDLTAPVIGAQVITQILALKIYVGDTPEIRLSLWISLSGYSVVKFFIRKPDGTIVSKTPTVQDEDAGILTYQFQTADFDQAGSYRIRPRVAFTGGNRFSGEPIFIDVEELDTDEKTLT